MSQRMIPSFRPSILAGLLLSAAASAMAQVPQASLQFGTGAPGYGHREDQFGDANFVEQEVVISGLARKFKGVGTLGANGQWNAAVASSATPYTTMMIVRRPLDPAKFNGVVIVEWLNVSTGYPLDVDWGMAQEAILRDGYAYVGINTQKVGVQGVQKLKQYGDRYAAGSIPDDDISYDIMSQTGQAVRDQFETLLGGLVPRQVIASGHSQSAIRLLTYTNAIQPIDKVFDGFLIHGRVNVGTRLAPADKLPSSVAVRSDTKVPVFLLQTEMEATLASGTSKQMDTDMIRQWEVAGAAHADQYLLDNIGLVSQREVGWAPPKCSGKYNAMPFYRAEIAAFHHLTHWIADGTPPPTAPRMQRDWLGSIKKDANGNALGGLRLPELDVPVAKYGFLNITTGSLAFLDLFACVAGGTTTPFSAAKLKSLYPTHEAYVAKYKAAADAAVTKGYILPPERDAGVQRAEAAKVPQ